MCVAGSWHTPQAHLCVAWAGHSMTIVIIKPDVGTLHKQSRLKVDMGQPSKCQSQVDVKATMVFVTHLWNRHASKWLSAFACRLNAQRLQSTAQLISVLCSTARKLVFQSG